MKRAILWSFVLFLFVGLAELALAPATPLAQTQRALLAGGTPLYLPYIQQGSTPAPATPPAQAQQSLLQGGTPLYLPYIQRASTPTPAPTPTGAATATPTPTATVDPSQQRIWDPRLTTRGAELLPANVEPGQGYWRLVKALWFNDDEPPFGGNVHIFVDLLDAAGNRLVGKPVRISNMDGTFQYQMIITEAKPGELYAASFRMGTLAPWYRAEPWDGSPADGIRGMGYGCLDQPWLACHTSYGLTWQWCIAGTEGATATPTPTLTPSATPTATATGDPASSTATPTPTATPPATAQPDRDWDPRLDQRGTKLIPALVHAGDGYWRLVKAVWYDVDDPVFHGKNYIYIDTLDQNGARQTGVLMRLSSSDGSTIFGTAQTEAKPGELYATSFAMNSVAPAYRAEPADGSPHDIVYGMGLGSLEYPYQPMLTSYGFTWQWTIATEDSAGLSRQVLFLLPPGRP